MPVMIEVSRTDDGYLFLRYPTSQGPSAECFTSQHSSSVKTRCPKEVSEENGGLKFISLSCKEVQLVETWYHVQLHCMGQSADALMTRVKDCGLLLDKTSNGFIIATSAGHGDVCTVRIPASLEEEDWFESVTNMELNARFSYD